MTKIEAYIRTHLLEKVHEALEAHQITGMTVIEVQGMGGSKGVHHLYRGSQYNVTLNPRLKLEIIVQDDQVDEIVHAIQSAASTGEVGDGKIMTIPLSSLIRIRTGEKDNLAL